VLQCVAVCCSVLQCVAMCCSVVQYVAVRCSMLQCVVLSSCIAVCVECCRVLQCGAVYFIFIFIRIFIFEDSNVSAFAIWVYMSRIPLLLHEGLGAGSYRSSYRCAACSVLQRVAACCIVLECVVAVCHGPSEGKPYA